MDQAILLAIVIPTATVLIGMLVNNRQMDFMRSELGAKIDRVDARVDSLREEMSAKLARVDARIDSLREEMTAKFDRVDARIDSLRNEMSARFEAQTQGLLRVEQVLDARLQHLEERYR